jgi:hypothetical protein
LITFDIELSEHDEKAMFDLLDSDKDQVIGQQEFFEAILGEKTNVKQLARSIRRVLK